MKSHSLDVVLVDLGGTLQKQGLSRGHLVEDNALDTRLSTPNGKYKYSNQVVRRTFVFVVRCRLLVTRSLRTVSVPSA